MYTVAYIRIHKGHRNMRNLTVQEHAALPTHYIREDVATCPPPVLRPCSGRAALPLRASLHSLEQANKYEESTPSPSSSAPVSPLKSPAADGLGAPTGM